MLNVTIRGSAANSYCTAAEAQDYLKTTGYDIDVWEASSGPRKERCLRIAAQILDSCPYIGSTADHAYYGSGYPPVYPDGFVPQHLKFPRDEDTQPIYGSEAIPTEVKEAQAEIAFLIVFPSYSKENPSDPVIESLSVKGDFTAKMGAGGSMVSSFGPPAQTVIRYVLKDYIKKGALV